MVAVLRGDEQDVLALYPLTRCVDGGRQPRKWLIVKSTHDTLEPSKNQSVGPDRVLLGSGAASRPACPSPEVRSEPSSPEMPVVSRGGCASLSPPLSPPPPPPPPPGRPPALATCAMRRRSSDP